MTDAYTVCLVVETRYHVTVTADSCADALDKVDIEAIRDEAPDDVNWYADWVKCGFFGERIDADIITGAQP
jgi:hypothetical protein